MWKEIFWFEVRYHLRHNVFYLAAVIFFISGLLLMSTGAGLSFSDAPATLNRNAPILIVQVLTFLSLLGLFAITSFVSSAALRDFERDTHMLFFSTPVRKFDYLAGCPNIHVLSDENPGDGFEPVTPDLEDVYMAAITRS